MEHPCSRMDRYRNGPQSTDNKNDDSTQLKITQATETPQSIRIRVLTLLALLASLAPNFNRAACKCSSSQRLCSKFGPTSVLSSMYRCGSVYTSQHRHVNRHQSQRHSAGFTLGSNSAGPARPDCYQSAQLCRQWTTNMELILEHQIRLCAPSSVISRPTCFSSSLRCC